MTRYQKMLQFTFHSKLLSIIISGRGLLIFFFPLKHQLVVLHAILPISIKLFQFKRSTPKLKHTNSVVSILVFSGGRQTTPPPQFYLVFTKEISSKQVKCMKLSLLWYSTNCSEDLHKYYCILSKYPTQVSVNLIDGLLINRGK